MGKMLTAPEKLNVAMRRRRVLELRRGGYNFYEIADAIREEFEDCPESYDSRLAYLDLQRLLDEMRSELSEALPDVIALEASRLDEMLKALWPAVLRGRERSIEIALKVMERRAEMLGLDSGIKVDWRIELVGLMNSGTLTEAEVRTQLGEELYASFMQYLEEKASETESTGVWGATRRWASEHRPEPADRPLQLIARDEVVVDIEDYQVFGMKEDELDSLAEVSA